MYCHMTVTNPAPFPCSCIYTRDPRMTGKNGGPKHLYFLWQTLRQMWSHPWSLLLKVTHLFSLSWVTSGHRDPQTKYADSKRANPGNQSQVNHAGCEENGEALLEWTDLQEFFSNKKEPYWNCAELNPVSGHQWDVSLLAGCWGRSL